MTTPWGRMWLISLHTILFGRDFYMVPSSRRDSWYIILSSVQKHQDTSETVLFCVHVSFKPLIVRSVSCIVPSRHMYIYGRSPKKSTAAFPAPLYSGIKTVRLDQINIYVDKIRMFSYIQACLVHNIFFLSLASYCPVLIVSVAHRPRHQSGCYDNRYMVVPYIVPIVDCFVQ